ARYLRRLLYSDKVKRGRILPEQESGVGFTVSKSGGKGGDFFFAQDVFREASERTGVAPDDLQARMWFAEKAYWRDRGWTKGAGEELSSFEGQMEKLITDRYQAGVTTYLNKETFDSVKHDAIIKALRQRIAANPDVISARVVRS